MQNFARVIINAKAMPLGLLLLHFIAHILLGVLGIIDPFELFNLLLLFANIVACILVLRAKGDMLLGTASMAIIALHMIIGQRLAPDSLTSGAVLLVNLLILYVGIRINEHLPVRYWYSFVVSYFVLFFIFIVLLDNAEALFLLFLMGLAACARSLRLLSFFWAITLSFTFCQPYAWESLIISFIILTALFRAKGALKSPIALVFLGTGLSLMFLVLLPVIVGAMNEDLHNIEAMLRDPRIISALLTTIKTATVSTVILMLFGVPLAYAISRLKFTGKILILSLIDLPIIIPQSAAGIALLTVFGRNQFLGNMFFDVFGVPIDGTAIGIIIAQVFVSMPFLIKASISAFDAVPFELEQVAQTLGAPPRGAFWRIALPLASKGVMVGAVLAWARAAGEFGAVVIIAPTPETAPVAAFNRFNSVGLVETGPLVALLILFSLAMFFLLQSAIRFLPTANPTEARL